MLRKIAFGSCLFLSLIIWDSQAQNYSMVNSGRLSLFSNGWETRGIEIEIEIPYGLGDGILRENYPTVEITQDGAKLMSGKGWLGGQVINEGGIDRMTNFSGEHLLFHTGFPINHSWQFYVDDIDHIVTATIDTIEEQTFIGITDSVKIITFETTFLGNPAPGWIDSIEVRVSKNYGLVEGFNYYEFPSFYSNPAQQFRVSHHMSNLVNHESPVSTYVISGLVTDSITYGQGLLSASETFDIPDTLRYTRLHNVYEYYNGGYGGNYNTYFDHLVINHDLTGGTSNIDAHTCYYNDWEEYTGFGIIYDTSNGVIDTMTIVVSYSDIWFEGRPYEFRPSSDGFEVALQLRSVTGRRILYLNENLQNSGLDSLIEGNVKHRDGFMHRLGKIYDYYESQSGSGVYLDQEIDYWKLMYYRIGAEEFADLVWNVPYEYHFDCIQQYIPEDTTTVTIAEIHDGLSIYPNPSSGVITIESKRAQPVQLIDIHGRSVNTFNLSSGNNRVAIEQRGLFLLRGENWTHRVVITN